MNRATASMIILSVLFFVLQPVEAADTAFFADCICDTANGYVYAGGNVTEQNREAIRLIIREGLKSTTFVTIFGHCQRPDICEHSHLPSKPMSGPVRVQLTGVSGNATVPLGSIYAVDGKVLSRP